MTNDICPTCGGTQAEIRERVWLMLRRRFPLCSGSDLLDAVMDELEPELSVLTVTPERLAALERVKVLEEVLKSAKELMPFMPVGYGGVVLSNLRHSIAALEEQKP